MSQVGLASPIQWTSPIIFEETEKSKFKERVEEFLISPPEWVAKHVQIVRQALNRLLESDHYRYNPPYEYENVIIKFEYNLDKYKLTLTKNENSKQDYLQNIQAQLNALILDASKQEKKNKTAGVNSNSDVSPRDGSSKEGSETQKEDKLIDSETLDIFTKFANNLEKKLPKDFKDDVSFITMNNDSIY